MKENQRKQIVDGLRDIRDAVAEVLRRDEKLGRPAGAILAAIAEIENAVNDAGIPPAQADSGGNFQKRRNKPKRYARETVGGIEMLAEYREDNAIPLRTPKEVLFALVEILSDANRRVSFGELQKKLAKRVGTPPADYQARIAIRFLMSQDARLISREKAKYHLCETENSSLAIKRVWSGL